MIGLSGQGLFFISAVSLLDEEIRRIDSDIGVCSSETPQRVIEGKWKFHCDGSK